MHLKEVFQVILSSQSDTDFVGCLGDHRHVEGTGDLEPGVLDFLLCC